MKELSTEEKVRAYDEAIEIATALYKAAEPMSGCNVIIETLFPELKEKENEDERIRKEIISALKFANVKGVYDKHIAWLEKQGEKKSADYENPNIQQNDFAPKSAMEAIKEEKVDNANKVEQKFKEGDWVVYQNQTFQVTKNSGNNLILQGRRYQTYFIEELCKPWTIDDARDGDVLVNDSNIFIFSHLSDTRAMGYCHINLDDRRFYDDKGKNECFGLIDAVFTPANKEQREKLFAAIHEAGYMWDTEGKQLVSLKAEPLAKLEQKSAWNEEDERIYQSIMDDTVQENQLNDKQTNWLRDIKYRYFPQLQEWSEEDEKILQGIWDEILANKHDAEEYEWKTYDKFLNWLNSLKDRVLPQPQKKWSEGDEKVLCKCLGALGNPNYCYEDGDLEHMRNWLHSLRPQSTWKPTKEQITAIRWVLNHIPYDSHKEEISGLLDQIKDL